ncbi:hypothetical protein V6N13_059766 [Hibiscus sabdariffa]|uniref:Histidine-containing phosphotransfer protein n=1 Tax=Hibiscus sabdariffa TaxID=183260 RepID=A0ABR2GCY5_9ROSI
MALAALKTQRKNLVQSMFDEGVLDNQFNQLQALQDSSNPNFVDEVVTLFCNDAERIVTDLNRYLNCQIVDFNKLDSHVHQLKGSSSSGYGEEHSFGAASSLSSMIESLVHIA